MRLLLTAGKQLWSHDCTTYAGRGLTSKSTLCKEEKQNLEFRGTKLAKIEGQSTGEERTAKKELQRSADRPPKVWLRIDLCTCTIKLLKAGKEWPKEQATNPWSSHRVGDSLCSHQSEWKGLIMFRTLIDSPEEIIWYWW